MIFTGKILICIILLFNVNEKAQSNSNDGARDNDPIAAEQSEEKNDEETEEVQGAQNAGELLTMPGNTRQQQQMPLLHRVQGQQQQQLQQKRKGIMINFETTNNDSAAADSRIKRLKAQELPLDKGKGKEIDFNMAAGERAFSQRFTQNQLQQTNAARFHWAEASPAVITKQQQAPMGSSNPRPSFQGAMPPRGEGRRQEAANAGENINYRAAAEFTGNRQQNRPELRRINSHPPMRSAGTSEHPFFERTHLDVQRTNDQLQILLNSLLSRNQRAQQLPNQMPPLQHYVHIQQNAQNAVHGGMGGGHHLPSLEIMIEFETNEGIQKRVRILHIPSGYTEQRVLIAGGTVELLAFAPSTNAADANRPTQPWRIPAGRRLVQISLPTQNQERQMAMIIALVEDRGGETASAIPFFNNNNNNNISQQTPATGGERGLFQSAIYFPNKCGPHVGDYIGDANRRLLLPYSLIQPMEELSPMYKIVGKQMMPVVPIPHGMAFSLTNGEWGLRGRQYVTFVASNSLTDLNQRMFVVPQNYRMEKVAGWYGPIRVEFIALRESKDANDAAERPLVVPKNKRVMLVPGRHDLIFVQFLAFIPAENIQQNEEKEEKPEQKVKGKAVVKMEERFLFAHKSDNTAAGPSNPSTSSPTTAHAPSPFIRKQRVQQMMEIPENEFPRLVPTTLGSLYFVELVPEIVIRQEQLLQQQTVPIALPVFQNIMFPQQIFMPDSAAPNNLQTVSSVGSANSLIEPKEGIGPLPAVESLSNENEGIFAAGPSQPQAAADENVKMDMQMEETEKDEEDKQKQDGNNSKTLLFGVDLEKAIIDGGEKDDGEDDNKKNIE